MKKILSFTLALLVMISVAVIPVGALDIAPVGGFAPDGMVDETCTTDEGYVYYVNEDGTATVCGVPEEETEVVIPTVVDGYTVSILGVYRQRFSGGEKAETLVVSDGILSIRGTVLSYFKNVSVIEFPSSLIEIRYPDFFNNTNYYRNPDNWDNGCLYIGTNLIAINTDAPEVLEIREDTTCVAETPYHKGSANIKEIILPRHHVYGIGNAISRTIESIVIPAEMGMIPDYFLSSCENLTDVTIEEGITSIGEGAFRLCESLTSINIPASVTSIDKMAFAGCTELKSIDIPETVSTIDEQALGYGEYFYSFNDYKYKYYPTYGFVISGKIGSAAYNYAVENNMYFVSSGDEATPDSATLDESCFGLIGDANIDGVVNVKDATAIQKHIAEMSTLCDEGVKLGDADQNGNLNVRDATAIQKHAAEMYTGYPIGDRSEVQIVRVVYGKFVSTWSKSDKGYFCCYDGNEELMCEIVAEYNSLVGAWGALVPVDAEFVIFGCALESSNLLPLPEKDGMIATPLSEEGVFVYQFEWK